MCDQGRFEDACQLYRGDFLAGFSLTGCREFGDWAYFRSEALRGRFVHALERVVDIKVGKGNAAELATYVVEKGKPFVVVTE